jgi:pimeloyl-ACP methyl ester carboxylesterase
LKNSFDEIIEELATTLPNEKINILGFSLGGYISTYFASKYPTRVNKLFVVGSAPCSISEDEILKRKNAIEQSKLFGFRGLSTKKIISLLEEKNRDNKELISLIGQMYIDLGQDVFIKQISATLTRVDLFEKLIALDIPITFFYSANDRLVNNSWLDEFKKVSKNSKFIKLFGNSHMLPLEEPLNLSNEIKRWS